MPPAFNLSQDQTLQFDLELLIQRIEVNFTSIFMSVCQSCDRTSFKIPVRNECHPKAATANTHAYRLYVFNDPQTLPGPLASPRSAKPSTITQFLMMSRKFFKFFFHPAWISASAPQPDRLCGEEVNYNSISGFPPASVKKLSKKCALRALFDPAAGEGQEYTPSSRSGRDLFLIPP